MLSGVILEDISSQLVAGGGSSQARDWLERAWAQQSAALSPPPTESAAVPSAPMVWVVIEPIEHLGGC